MKNRIAIVFTLLAISPLLTNCASQGDVNSLDYQLRVVNQKLEDMKMGTVGQMQQRQAASSSQIDNMRQEVLVLRGKIEEMAHFSRQLKEQNKELELSYQQNSVTIKKELENELKMLMAENQAIKARLDQLESRLKQQIELLENIQQNRIREAKLKADAAALAAEKARNRATASSKVLSSSSNNGVLTIDADKKKIIVAESNKPSAKPQENVRQKTVSTGEQSTSDLLSNADQAFAAGNFKKGYDLYEKYLQDTPGGDKAVKAQFMMAECLFYLEEYDQAILQYQKIISNHSNHPRAATSLLKQGMAFEKLSDLETARIIYKKITVTYPSSPEAASAKERSANLK